MAKTAESFAGASNASVSMRAHECQAANSMNGPTLTARAKTLITGNSEMADRIRAHNWVATPLGPIEEWSETLVATVNLMLHSPFPTILSWGPEMVFLYNDAAIPTLMGKHPQRARRSLPRCLS